MSGIWRYAADIIERAGATKLSLYALIVLCGAFLIYNSAKRVSPLVAFGGGICWFLIATLLLAVIVPIQTASTSNIDNRQQDASRPAKPDILSVDKTRAQDVETDNRGLRVETNGDCSQGIVNSNIDSITQSCSEKVK